MSNRSEHPLLFLSAAEKTRVVAAICAAELRTSGEIRVHLAGKVKKDILEQAVETFEKLGMTKTAARNGVLIFIRTEDSRFAVLGDRDIHQKVPENFWNSIAQTMSAYLQKNQFAEGLIAGITKIGEVLEKEFPHQRDDINELPDEISYSL